MYKSGYRGCFGGGGEWWWSGGDMVVVVWVIGRNKEGKRKRNELVDFANGICMG